MVTIVIRSRTKERISGTFCFEWSMHKAWRDSRGELHMENHLLTRQKAQAIIERRGLVESYSTKDGEIYDTPEGDFKALFPFGLLQKEDMETISKTDKL